MTTNNDDNRPTYGERATPEEQRAAAGLPPLPFQPIQPEAANPVAPAEGAPSYLPPLYPEQQAPTQPPAGYPGAVPPGYAEGYPPPAGYAQQAQPGAYPQQGYPAHYPQAQYGQAAYPASYAPGYVPARVPGKANKIWTIVLLAIGLLTVINSTFSYLNPVVLASTYDVLFPGISSSFDLAALRSSGMTATVVLWIGFALTTWFSWFMYKKQKYTWWIPLVGGLIFPLVAGSIAMGPVMDAITRYVS